MRIHLGHHFYGAGNLGDDFMLAGFLAAMARLSPEATFSCSVPFPLTPLQRRFPAITWLPYDETSRHDAIARADVWLGLGGSPFQNAQSRWFIDHLLEEQRLCRQHHRPQFFLGVGVQTPSELASPEVQQLAKSAAGIWTRDTASADRLRSVAPDVPVAAAADLAHILFRDTPPSPAVPGRIALVPNFDYGTWPGQQDCLQALVSLPAPERVWVAQESRDLPGGERALYAALSPAQTTDWQLVLPDQPGTPLTEVLPRWPSSEWLITARYHAAIAGAWAGSKMVVIATNEKLQAAANELQLPHFSPHADEPTVRRALANAKPSAPPHAHAERAFVACTDFLRSAVAHVR